MMVEHDHGYDHGSNTMYPNGYLTLLRSLGIMLHYDVYQHSSHISRSINGYVTLQHSSQLMLHCDIH